MQDPNVLPPATQTGANTAGCLVDGKVVVFSTNFSGGISHSYENSYYREEPNRFRIKLYMTQVGNKNQGFSLYVDINEKFELNKPYIVGNTQFSNDYFPSNNLFIAFNGMGYRTNDNNRCEVVFTKLSTHTDKKFISGTFKGKLISKDGKAVNITEGRFDKDFFLE